MHRNILPKRYKRIQLPVNLPLENRFPQVYIEQKKMLQETQKNLLYFKKQTESLAETVAQLNQIVAQILCLRENDIQIFQEIQTNVDKLLEMSKEESISKKTSVQVEESITESYSSKSATQENLEDLTLEGEKTSSNPPNLEISKDTSMPPLNCGRYAGEQISFDIFSTEKALLAKLTHIFKQHGFLALWNQVGKMTFFMDGSQNPYKLCAQIEKLALQGHQNSSENTEIYESRTKVARELLEKYKFLPSLKGTQYLLKILLRLSYQPHLLQSMSKGVYAELVDLHACDPKVIDRSIRYSVERSTLEGRNSSIVLNLFNEYIEILGLHLY